MYLDEDDSMKHNEHIKLKTGRKKTYNDEIKEFVKLKLDTCKQITIKKLRALVHEKFTTYLSKTTVYRIIKEINYSFKKVTIDKYPHSDEKRKQQVKDLQIQLKNKNNRNFCVLDEASIDINIKESRGYSKK